MDADLEGSALPDGTAAALLAAARYSTAGNVDVDENDPELDEMLEAEWRYYGHDEWEPKLLPCIAPRRRIAPRQRERRSRISRRVASASRDGPDEPEPPDAAPLAARAATARPEVGA
jgi:hypothetical protein